MSTETELLVAPGEKRQRPRRDRTRKKLTPGQIVVMVVLAVLVLIVASPVLYALLNSFRSYSA